MIFRSIIGVLGGAFLGGLVAPLLGSPQVVGMVVGSLGAALWMAIMSRRAG